MTQNIDSNSILNAGKHKMLSKKQTCKELTAEYFSLIQNHNLPPSELASQLDQLNNRVTKLRNSTSKTLLLKKINKAINIKKQTITKQDLRKSRENFLITSKQERSQKILFQHLVLDSLALFFPKMIRNNGIDERISLAFLGSQLVEFAKVCKKHDRDRVLNLHKSFQLALDISEIRDLPSTKDPENYLSKLLILTLTEMSSGKRNHPLLISAGTQSHAAVLNITFSEKTQYVLTLINTGIDSIKHDESGLNLDLRFPNLTLQNLKELPRIVLDRPKKYPVFLQRLKDSFSHSDVEDYALLNRGQKGDSCASKSLTCFLNYALSCGLKKEFKVFMTKNLLNHQEHPSLKKLGNIILKKRQLKLTLNQLEKKCDKLKACKEDISQYGKTLSKLRALFQNIEQPYDDSINPEKNIIQVKKWIHSQLSTITDHEYLKKILKS